MPDAAIVPRVFEMTIPRPSIDVSIAAHYVPRRVPFLVAALDSIASWQRPVVRARIVTNDLALARESALAAAVERLHERGFAVTYEAAHSMAHPYHLTWWHKTHLREWSKSPGHPDDLFVYIEDDMAITEANLAYFERYLPSATSVGCIPGFVVYEEAPDGKLVAQGFRGSHLVRDEEYLALEGQLFVAPKFPYWPGFIMNRALCEQYWRSPWSDMGTAEALPQARGHTCRVHSAWALAYDSVPEGLTSRYIVPVDHTLCPLPHCRVLHTAGNYAVSKKHGFGTVGLDRAFRRPTAGARLANLVWRGQTLARRIAAKLERELSTRASAAKNQA